MLTHCFLILMAFLLFRKRRKKGKGFLLVLGRCHRQLAFLGFCVCAIFRDAAVQAPTSVCTHAYTEHVHRAVVTVLQLALLAHHWVMGSTFGAMPGSRA